MSDRLYRQLSLAAAVTFALVGLIFLLAPNQVHVVFNNLSAVLGMATSPAAGPSLYLALAVAYMYVVALLAYLMYRLPEVRLLPLVLAQAKLASAVLSLYLFVMHGPYLIYLANCLIDGMIGAAVMWVYLHRAKDVTG